MKICFKTFLENMLKKILTKYGVHSSRLSPGLRPKSVQNGALDAQGPIFRALGVVLARKNWNPKSRPSLDASDHSVSVILGAYWAENGRPGSDTGTQVGRRVGPK